MYPFFRPLFFRLPPERAHALTLALLRLVGRLPPLRAALRLWYAVPDRPVQAFGLAFRNPIGLAAGYDKDGFAWRGLASLGFGHIELGSVTPRPQPGNPPPRLFRLPEDHALINRMGFPGKGAEVVLRNLAGARPPGLILGVNLGKNKDTPLESAVQDYASLLRTFAPCADYLAINVSSPNTEGLRRLQARQLLSELLSALHAQREALATSLGRSIPLLVKLSPDLRDDELDDALLAILDSGMDGVIVANTTTGRASLASALASEPGGLSGAPLRLRSTAMIRAVHQRLAGRLPIIGVGGIMDSASAQEKMQAGAVLLQIYTGLVYAGPGLVKSILRGF